MPAGTFGYALVAMGLTLWAAGGSPAPVDPDENQPTTSRAAAH